MKLEYILLVYLLSSIVTWLGMRALHKVTASLDFWYRYPDYCYAVLPLLPLLNTIFALLFLYWFAVEYPREKNKN
jgi:hypothetical protein